MERCRDYFCFAVTFAGLGYVALWPLAAYGGSLFGGWPHPADLSPALHLAGTLSALFAAARFLLIAARRMRPPQPAPRIALMPRSARRRPLRTISPVKPRSHFGLRGKPG
jgi:hypothetical protein